MVDTLYSLVSWCLCGLKHASALVVTPQNSEPPKSPVSGIYHTQKFWRFIPDEKITQYLPYEKKLTPPFLICVLLFPG